MILPPTTLKALGPDDGNVPITGSVYPKAAGAEVTERAVAAYIPSVVSAASGNSIVPETVPLTGPSTFEKEKPKVAALAPDTGASKDRPIRATRPPIDFLISVDNVIGLNSSQKGIKVNSSQL